MYTWYIPFLCFLLERKRQKEEGEGGGEEERENRAGLGNVKRVKHADLVFPSTLPARKNDFLTTN